MSTSPTALAVPVAAYHAKIMAAVALTLVRQTVTGGQGGYAAWPVAAGRATLRGVSGGAASPWWQAMTPSAAESLCRCGHAHGAHQHYRRGSDCALCDCPRWRPPGRLRRLLRLRAS